MEGFNEAVKEAVDEHGIMAVANACQTSPLIVRRWTEGFPPYSTSQASVLKALDELT